jgi:hypothetical protein
MGDRDIGPLADLVIESSGHRAIGCFVIPDFRSQQIDSSFHLTLSITDMGKCHAGGCPSALPVFALFYTIRFGVILSSSEGSRPARFSLPDFAYLWSLVTFHSSLLL